MDLGTYASDLIGVVVVFAFFSFCSADLGVDLAQVRREALPTLNLAFVLMMDHARQRQIYRWQVWSTRVVDGGFVLVALAMPVTVWLPGNYPDLGVRLIWVGALIVDLLWLAYLLQLPRAAATQGGRR